MKTFLYVPFLSSFLLVVFGSIYSYRGRNYGWLLLSLFVAMVMSGGVVYFLLENVGKAIHLQPFDKDGLYISMGAGGAVALFGLIGFLLKKKWMPFLFILLIGLFHVISIWIASSYFNPTVPLFGPVR